MIKPLTSLRFIFALMVFTSHLFYIIKGDSTYLSWIFDNIFKEGYIGVSFFFILSGFILSFKYQEPLLNRTQSRSSFLIARFARIYPLHILCFVLAIPASFSTFVENKTEWTIAALSNITLTQSFIPFRSIYFAFNTPSWSISDEMFFYLLFPILIALILKMGKHKFGLTLLTISLVPLAILIVPEKFHHQFLYVNPVFRIFDFIIGIFLYNIFKKISSLKIKLNFSFLEFSAIFLLILFVSIHSLIPEVLRFSVYYWIPMSFLVLIFAFQKGVVSDFLSNKYLLLLGEISFGFYMFHHLILRYLVAINKRFIGIENEYILIFLTLGLTITVSYFSFIWFETPANKYIRSKWGNKILLPKMVDVAQRHYSRIFNK
jgi:peptidoglycan/LPS O-acetylase OafA/YrhL